jgi:hypothetical protein
MDKEVKEGDVKITSKELNMLKLWIALNKKELLLYWKTGEELETSKFLGMLKPV